MLESIKFDIPKLDEDSTMAFALSLSSERQPARWRSPEQMMLKGALQCKVRAHAAVTSCLACKLCAELHVALPSPHRHGTFSLETHQRV